MYCMNCGTKLVDEAKFCYNCGQKVYNVGETENAQKDRNIADQSSGENEEKSIHRFYRNYWKKIYGYTFDWERYSDRDFGYGFTGGIITSDGEDIFIVEAKDGARTFVLDDTYNVRQGSCCAVRIGKNSEKLSVNILSDIEIKYDGEEWETESGRFLQQRSLYSIYDGKIYLVFNIFRSTRHIILSKDMATGKLKLVKELPRMKNVCAYLLGKSGQEVVMVDNDTNRNIVNLTSKAKRKYDWIIAYNDEYIYYERNGKLFCTDYSAEIEIKVHAFLGKKSDMELYYVDASDDTVYFIHRSERKIEIVGYGINGNEKERFTLEEPEDKGAFLFFDGKYAYIIYCQEVIDEYYGTNNKYNYISRCVKYDKSGREIGDVKVPESYSGGVGVPTITECNGELYFFGRQPEKHEFYFVSGDENLLFKYC